MRQQKVARIQAYKDQLDSQVRVKAAYRGMGNMTAAEKQMNRDDLHAWKKYDNNQYAMIPGLTSQKQQAQIRPKKSPISQSAKANDLYGSVKRLTSIEKEE